MWWPCPQLGQPVFFFRVPRSAFYPLTWVSSQGQQGPSFRLLRPLHCRWAWETEIQVDGLPIPSVYEECASLLHPRVSPSRWAVQVGNPAGLMWSGKVWGQSGGRLSMQGQRTRAS